MRQRYPRVLGQIQSLKEAKKPELKLEASKLQNSFAKVRDQARSRAIAVLSGKEARVPRPVFGERAPVLTDGEADRCPESMQRIPNDRAVTTRRQSQQ